MSQIGQDMDLPTEHTTTETQSEYWLNTSVL